MKQTDEKMLTILQRQSLDLLRMRNELMDMIPVMSKQAGTQINDIRQMMLELRDYIDGFGSDIRNERI